MIPQIAFITSCVLLQFSYGKDGLLLFDHIDGYGRLSESKQVYVIKNMLKGLYLCVIVLLSVYFVLPGMLNNEWDNVTLQTFASLYVSNDIVVLICREATRLYAFASHDLCYTFTSAWGADLYASKQRPKCWQCTRFFGDVFSCKFVFGSTTYHLHTES